MTEDRNFFEACKRTAESLVYSDDKDAFLKAMDRETLLEALHRNNAFVMTYRYLVDDSPVYVSMRVSSLKDDSRFIVVGVTNVDEQMKQRRAAEQVKEEQIAYARLRALAGDFLCIFSVVPETSCYREYSATSLNKDYFFRYAGRLDHLYKDHVLDAVVCDIDRFHSLNKQYGRQFGDQVLRSIGRSIQQLACKTGGIGCRKDGDLFLLYCPHQPDYEHIFRTFLSEILDGKETTDRVHMRFGVFADARREPDIEERFERAKIAADRVKNDPENVCGFYDLK